jgi:hypothetical protein
MERAATTTSYSVNAPNYACGCSAPDPDHRSHPLSTIPFNRVVFMSIWINHSGSTESGDIKHLVAVPVAPGFDSAPGCERDEKIIATVC